MQCYACYLVSTTDFSLDSHVQAKICFPRFRRDEAEAIGIASSDRIPERREELAVRNREDVV